ncbi:MAG: excinuclease ABC subunit UvrA [Deltaproteobacteria bacterium]|nr:excinuclease ABC subunit UvrA [Deltaproteobacteria bacterium]
MGSRGLCFHLARANPSKSVGVWKVGTLNHLTIRGARQNNLKNISLDIPHNKLTVITGVSGSGKSSLAFDTLFAEGQWRYVESLSTYARMFIEKLDRPDVDEIGNIRPAIAIEQKNPVRTSRSTVGTATELSDYLRLLYAKIGKIHCVECGVEVSKETPTSLADKTIAQYSGDRAFVLFPRQWPPQQTFEELKSELLKEGFLRIKVGSLAQDLEEPHLQLRRVHAISVVVDRLEISEQGRSRLVEAFETAFQRGQGTAQIEVVGRSLESFSSERRCRQCGRRCESPHPLLFSFNSPLGACSVCRGFGNILRYDPDKAIPNRSLSLRQGAVEPWTKPAYRGWSEQLAQAAPHYKMDLDTPWARLPKKIQKLVFEGGRTFYGIDEFFQKLEEKRYKLHVRVFLSRYKSPFICSECQGMRLRREAMSVRIHSLSIGDFCRKTVDEASEWFKKREWTRMEREIAEEILGHLSAKLDLLRRVGLHYLTLDRQTKTLSGGESQRIALANHIGSKLVGTLYVLDEPTIGLHPRDTERLASLVYDLTRQGNTGIVVEHDRTLIEKADHIVELGPGGGEGGGNVLFSGSFEDFRRSQNTLTAQYLRGELEIPIPAKRRPLGPQWLVVEGASEHNLKEIDVRIPLTTFTCITGVSGAGKSTLLYDVLYAALARIFKIEFPPMGRFKKISGMEYLQSIRLIDQEPIGKTPRSNPITYVKAFDEIRRIFASVPEAQWQGLNSGHFSFNVEGGRCPHCQGAGKIRLEMYFFEDIYVSCDRCQGRRYLPEVLRVRYQGKNISEVLEMTVSGAVPFFRDYSSVVRPLHLLDEMGLGYLRLGQPATTLSGGESQRLKICAEVQSQSQRGVLYLLDEPTTGLHTHDVRKLLQMLQKLVSNGNTVVVVEHHLDVMKVADYILDLGPEGGEEGGRLVAVGTPEEIAQVRHSYTGQALQPHLRSLSVS